MTAEVIQWEAPRPPTATAHVPTNCSCVLQSPTPKFLGEDLIASLYIIHPQLTWGVEGEDQAPLATVKGSRHHYPPRPCPMGESFKIRNHSTDRKQPPPKKVQMLL